MRVGFPGNRSTLAKLWAWRRAGRSTLGHLLTWSWHPAHDDTGAEWVVSDDLSPVEAQQAVATLDELSGVNWHTGSATDDRVELQPLGGGGGRALQLDAVHELSLDAFLLTLPWEREPVRPRDVLVVARGRSVAEQIVEDLATVADTTVLEGVRCAAGVPGPWPASDKGDTWFRMAEPPYFLLRRWLDCRADNGEPQARLYRLMPPTASGRPHLWVAWGYEPALVEVQQFDPADMADQLILVAPREPLRMLPVSVFAPLAERLEPDTDGAGELRIARADALEPIPVAVRYRPRTDAAEGRLWRIPEDRLRNETGWYERMPESARRNLMVAACADREGRAILYVMEQVRGKSLAELRAMADPMCEVPGLPNCFLPGHVHLVPEVSAAQLRPLVYRGADAAGVATAWRQWWSAQDAKPGAADELQRDWLDALASELSLPLAVLDAERPDGGLVDATVGTLPDGGTRDRMTAPESAEAMADPWGAAAAASTSERPSNVNADALEWRVYFLTQNAFKPFDSLGTLLMRDSLDALRSLQAGTRIAMPEEPPEAQAGPVDD